MIPAHQALRCLREGNDRFMGDDRTFRTTVSPARRAALVEQEGLRIVGAEYSLETGKVDFFEEFEEPA